MRKVNATLFNGEKAIRTKKSRSSEIMYINVSSPKSLNCRRIKKTNGSAAWFSKQRKETERIKIIFVLKENN